MKKFLIVGLGNIGAKYEDTRHNIGFKALDTLAENREVVFEVKKLGAIVKFRYKGRIFVLLKPATFMNLSGKAVRYWLLKEKVPMKNLLVICDDVSLPFGTLRLKSKGSAGGHNGLQNIQEMLKTQQYPRLRFGIGNDFSKGGQTDYVLGKWTEKEQKTLPEHILKTTNAIVSFGTAGIVHTMNEFNGK